MGPEQGIRGGEVKKIISAGCAVFTPQAAGKIFAVAPSLTTASPRFRMACRSVLPLYWRFTLLHASFAPGTDPFDLAQVKLRLPHHLRFYAYLADSAYYVIGGVLAFVYGNHFQWDRVVVGAQD